MVTRFDRETLPGYVNPQTYLQDSGLELLTPEGTVSLLPYSDLKLVCFVRDFMQGEPRRELRRRPHERTRARRLGDLVRRGAETEGGVVEAVSIRA